MAKSANDNTTRPQLSGCSGTPHPTCVLSWSGGLSPQWGPGAKPLLRVWTGEEVPRSLSILINFAQNFSNPVI